MALKQDGVHFLLCPKQGNKIAGFFLDRVCILGYFGPKQGQGFKPSAAQHLYTNIRQVPPGACYSPYLYTHDKKLLACPQALLFPFFSKIRRRTSERSLANFIFRSAFDDKKRK